MLIYEKINDKVYVTQVTYGFSERKIELHRARIKEIQYKYQQTCRDLEPGQVFVLGDTSIVQGGLQPREVYNHILNNNNYEDILNKNKKVNNYENR